MPAVKKKGRLKRDTYPKPGTLREYVKEQLAKLPESERKYAEIAVNQLVEFPPPIVVGVKMEATDKRGGCDGGSHVDFMTRLYFDSHAQLSTKLEALRDVLGPEVVTGSGVIVVGWRRGR